MTNLRCCASQERVDVSPAANEAEAEAEDKTRRIVFAVDGTPASEQGLAWLTRNVLQKSTDVVYLANIVCDSRTLDGVGELLEPRLPHAVDAFEGGAVACEGGQVKGLCRGNGNAGE